MDFVAGVKRVTVLAEHVARNKDGMTALKILSERTFPLTGRGRSYHPRSWRDGRYLDGLKLVERAEGVTFAEIQAKTGMVSPR